MREQVLEIVEQGDYEHYGLRVTDIRGRELVGEQLAPSRIWIDGEPTEEYLAGTSAVLVSPRKIDRALRILSQYVGDTILLLGSRGYEDGQDEGEAVMREPVVLAVFKKQ